MGCCLCREEEPVGKNDDQSLKPLGGDKTDNDNSFTNPQHGKPRQYDPNFRGPSKQRSCTDLICLFFFIICILIHVVVIIFAFRKGNPAILLRPTDSQGNVCGYGQFQSLPKLIYFDVLKCAHSPGELVIKGCNTPQMCIASCPTETHYSAAIEMIETATVRSESLRRKQLVCQYSHNYTDLSKSISELVKEEKCAPYVFASFEFFGRCVPRMVGNDSTDPQRMNVNITKFKDATIHLMKDFFKKRSGFLSGLIADLSLSWPHILIGIGIGAIITFVWCMLLQCFACLFVYLTLLLFFVAFVASTVYCFYRYIYLAPNKIDWAGGNLVLSLNPTYYLNLKETWLCFGIISAIFTIIILLLLLCLGKQIKLAISLLREATKTIASNILTLIFPIIPWLLQSLVFLLWAATAIHLASVGTPVFSYRNRTSDLDYNINATIPDDDNPNNPNSYTVIHNASECTRIRRFSKVAACYFVNYSGPNWVLYLQLYNIFMAFWMSCFVVSMGELILGYVFSSWYWSFNKSKDLPSCLLIRSTCTTIRYHMGSAALGSLLIATTRFIRFLLELVHRQFKNSETTISRIGFSILRCCFWCLEKCLKFLNKNAYIMISIHGRAFCYSARDALLLIMRNALRVMVLNSVTSFLLFVGKLLITGVTGCLVYLFFDGLIPNTVKFIPQINYIAVPVIAVVVGTWFVATLFFDVFDFAVDTLFLCCMEDLERNDGSQERPYFMSKSLLDTLHKKNDPNVESKRGNGCCSCCQ